MGILDRFKKKEEAEEKSVKREKAVKREKKPVAKAVKQKTEKKVTEKEAKPKKIRKVEKKEYSQAYRILEAPLVTEKATDMNNFNKYVFKVKDDANKAEVKKAVQDLYGVAVEAVNILKSPGKKRRVGRHEGWHSGFKKAIVKLAEGEKIEIIAR